MFYSLPIISFCPFFLPIIPLVFSLCCLSHFSHLMKDGTCIILSKHFRYWYISKLLRAVDQTTTSPIYEFHVQYCITEPRIWSISLDYKKHKYIWKYEGSLSKNIHKKGLGSRNSCRKPDIMRGDKDEDIGNSYCWGLVRMCDRPSGGSVMWISPKKRSINGWEDDLFSSSTAVFSLEIWAFKRQVITIQ